MLDDLTRRYQAHRTGSLSLHSPPTYRVPSPGGDVEVPLPQPLVRSRGTANLLMPSLATLDRLIHTSI